MIKCLIIIDARCKHEDSLEQLSHLRGVKVRSIFTIIKVWMLGFLTNLKKQRDYWAMTRNVTHFTESSSKLQNYFEFQKRFRFYTIVPNTENCEESVHVAVILFINS